MKNKLKIYGSCLILAITFVLITVFAGAQQVGVSNDEFSGLTFRVNAEKSEFILGEPVKLEIEIINGTDKPINFPQCALRPDLGSMKIMVAQTGSSFEEHRGPGWGVKDKWCGDSPIEPGQKLTSQISVFWNPTTPTAGLNNDAAKRLTEGKVMTEYVFPKAGNYIVKVSLGYLGDNRPKFDSMTTQILEKDPTGEDLEIWNKLKANGQLGYFLQKGGFLTSKDNEVKGLLMSLDEIAQRHPDSLLGRQIQQNLLVYRRKQSELQKMERKN